MKFYVLDENLYYDTIYALGEKVDPKFGDSENCPYCGSALTSLKWLPPYKVKLTKPIFGDFVFGSVHPFLASENFKNKYIKSNLKGILKFDKVEIVKINRIKKDALFSPNYYYVSIVRSQTRIEETISKFERTEKVKCDKCRTGGIIKNYKGYFFEKGTYDNNDIFIATGLPGRIFISQKFYDFGKENNFTNLNFIQIEEYRPYRAIFNKKTIRKV